MHPDVNEHNPSGCCIFLGSIYEFEIHELAMPVVKLASLFTGIFIVIADT